MFKNSCIVTFIACLTFGCGGGTGPNGTETNTDTSTNACTATGLGAAANCVTTGTGGTAGTGGTTIVTGTGGTGSTTGTGSVTGTDTSTSTTTVVVPDWFKVKDLPGQLLNSTGGIFANVDILPIAVNGDGTWTAKTVCEGNNCAAIDLGTWTGSVSDKSFSIKNISAIGVVPATGPASAHTSGTWSYAGDSGTFYF